MNQSANKTAKERFYEVLKDRSVPSFSKKYRGQLFALIIGIDNYPNHQLRGAVSDANAIFTFLTTQLCIPHQNITNLRDREATRARIIHELEELVRKKIPRDAAILVYYAGHGTKMSIPADWTGYHTANGVIEAICPVDIQQLHTNGTRTVTPAIPDRVLNCLLHEISEAHGNNIVAIFDCCHSGGLARNLSQPDLSMTSKSRSISMYDYTTAGHMTNPPPLPSNMDRAILDRSKSLPVNEPRDSRVSGYVHIAAVSREQVADELTPDESTMLTGGIFTTFLLDVLKSTPTAVDDLSYKAIIDQVRERMKRCFGPEFSSKRQPQCEGLYIHRRIFSVDIRDRLITGTWVSKGSEPEKTMRIDAGAAHGVVKQSKFSIFSDDTGINKPLIDNVGVEHVSPVETILRYPFESGIDLPSTFYAKRIPSESITVLIQNNEDLISTLDDISFQDSLGITVTMKPSDQHDLRIAIEEREIVFYWGRENLFTKVLGPQLPRTLPLEKKGRLLAVIRAFAAFEYHLMRVADTKEEILKQHIQVDLKKISGGLMKVTSGDDLLGETKYIPIGQRGRSSSLCLNVYHNLEQCPDLYIYIFYFSSDLGIRPVFLPSHASNWVNSDGPTVAFHGKLSIGFGDGGKPLHFILPTGTDVDLGYLKIFVTTKPVDFYPLVQQSPFVELENDTGTRSRGPNSSQSRGGANVTPTSHGAPQMLSYNNLQMSRMGFGALTQSRHIEEDMDEGDEASEAGWGTLKYAVVQRRTAKCSTAY